jgi:RNA polymerase sigma-70 factor (ECF subfamily)
MVSYDDSVDLVLCCQRGDRQSLGILAERVQGRLFGYLCRITSSDDAAWEILQDVLLTVVVKIKQLCRADRFWPWVRAITRRKVQDYFRANYMRRQAEAEFKLRSGRLGECHSSFQVRMERREVLRRIYTAKQELSKAYAEVFELRCFAGLSYSEIAAVTGSDCRNARLRFHRARKALCERFGPNIEEHF